MTTPQALLPSPIMVNPLNVDFFVISGLSVLIHCRLTHCWGQDDPDPGSDSDDSDGSDSDYFDYYSHSDYSDFDSDG